MFENLVIHNEWIRNIAGGILALWGLCDGVKYSIAARKIRDYKTSVGHSRKFIELAIGNDLYRVFYFIFIDQNVYLFIASILALLFMLDMLWAMYIYYPYQTYPRRIVKRAKRPNIFVYLHNAWLSNKVRKAL